MAHIFRCGEGCYDCRGKLPSLLHGDGAGEREAEARGAKGHGGRANGFYHESRILEPRGDVQRRVVAAEQDGHDVGGALASRNSGGGEFVAKGRCDFGEMGAALVRFAGEREGGANLMGGEGGAYGAFVGSALIFVIRNSLLMAGVDSNWQGILVGSFIVLAVVLERIRGKRRE